MNSAKWFCRMRSVLLLGVSCLLSFVSSAQIVALTNGLAVASFDRFGRLVSCRERATDRELLAKPLPFVCAGKVLNGGYEGATQLKVADGDFVFTFKNGGSISLRPKLFSGGFSFSVVDCSLIGMNALYLGRFSPVPSKWTGRRANMMSDELSGVCVRAYDIFQTMQIYPGLIQVRVPVEKAVGARFGIVAAERKHLADALKQMTIESGRPHSSAGGPWAMQSEAVRGSYLNANVTAKTLDDWIRLAERGGFEIVHFRENWYGCRGHYPVNLRDWPGGVDELKAAVEKIHKVGYRAGLHTLSGCIDPKDSWVSGSENSLLIPLAKYTLAEDLPADAAEMAITETPTVRHDVVFTYSGNGNAIRIGNEIVQYDGIVKGHPFRFTGLKRGAFGTKAAAHAKGAAADYLQQRYIAFYPEPDSMLADKVADAIAHVYNYCGFDQIYCDGAEGMFSPYGTAMMRDKIMARCTADGRACINEDSVGCPSHAWWYHSRVGAWDSCFWAPKRFHDFHVEKVKKDDVRNSDLLEIQMGWWAPLLSTAYCTAHKIDDMEYYASRNTGLDASMSVSSINLARAGLRYHISRMMTVLGWYERARRARAFYPSVQKAFDRQGAEFRLRQDAVSGDWTVAGVESFSRRAVSPETGKFEIKLKTAPEKVALRVEALYAADNLRSNAVVLTEGVAAENLVTAVAGTNIRIKAACASAEGGKRVFRLSAQNGSGKRSGAWARASAVFSPYRRIGDCRVMRFGVCGDGSGALLNVQPVSPPEYGRSLSEHYVKLDFTGWRKFEMPLRERDADRFADYEWPYTWYASVFHSVLKPHAVSELNFYLNDIPAGGKVDICVSDVEFVPQRPIKISRHGVKINDTIVPVPFAMESGQFAELEDGYWILYSPDGDPLQRKCAKDLVPRLSAGKNNVVYRAETVDGTMPRAEVSVFAIGRPGKAFRPESSLSEAERKILAYEAVDPQYYAPSRGFDTLLPVVVRPGMTAGLEVTVYGPTCPFRIKAGDVRADIPAVEKGCNRTIAFKGEFSGVNPVEVEVDPAVKDFAARLEFVKRYR